jgi:uncharacterized protein YbjT (DUF2867 family)
MPVYAVTGASGHLGRFAIKQLLARSVPPSHVVAVVRTRGKATSRGCPESRGTSVAVPVTIRPPSDPHSGLRY